MASDQIFPFLWLKGESGATIKDEISRIDSCGIKAFCVESRPHPDFMGSKWWEDLDLIMGEAKKRGMRVWLLDDSHFPTGFCNGAIRDKYPERRKRYIDYNIADVWGKSTEMELNIGSMLAKRRSWRNKTSQADLDEQKNNKLVAVVAYPVVEGRKVDESQGIDLTHEVDDGWLKHRFSAKPWRVFVVFETRCGGGNPDYIDLLNEQSVKTLIDEIYEPHYQRYKEEFGKTFAGFFSDEPGFGNSSGFDKDERIGVKQMPLPWSDEVCDSMNALYGREWRLYLPFLWTPSIQDNWACAARVNYMDIVTSIASRNFGGQIGTWCSKRGVEYTGHVIEDNNQHDHLGCGPGHYFRFMEGQQIAGIDTIGCQIAYGGNLCTRGNSSKSDGEFFQYALAKLGSSSGALDANKAGRTMCELFGAYGWGLSVRDMKWIADSLLVRGVNHFVPHAFSMHDYPDPDCPAHFYARGNNPQFPFFAELMGYLGRVGELISGGRPQVQVAVLYQGEQEWAGNYMPMQKPARILSQHQIDFLFVSADMLAERAEVDGDRFVINGVEFDALVVPYSDVITDKTMRFIRRYVDGAVIFVDRYPSRVVAKGSTVSFEPCTCCSVTPLDDLPSACHAVLLDPIELDQPFLELAAYHYVRSDSELFLLHNESSSEAYEGGISLPTDKSLSSYDGFTDGYTHLNAQVEEGRSEISVAIEPYGMLVLVAGDKGYGQVAESSPNKASNHETHADLTGPWSVSSCRSIDYPRFVDAGKSDELTAFSDSHEAFSGYIRYETEVVLDCDCEEALLEAENVEDAARVWVDDALVSSRLYPPFRFALGDLKSGAHMIRIEVSTTLERENAFSEHPSLPPSFEALRPTGMFGGVTLRYREV
ncbi:MAG: glycosyl hydrolase [Atopobiaceae bacterium]|jgi:hypothetical protein|nr:hypothetical protein [Atopobiaceae bacterium]MDD3177419.1 glycosyl hydrolase [Atopobiaceae bacterium]MDD3485635.1 glycosyl hydrolase [Atopobiaceae bacterium]